MKFNIKNLKKKLQDKKGMSTFEFAICMMIFLMMFTFLCDLFFILYKQYVVTSACSEIVRQIGIQGGISTTKPENYPGDDNNYLTYKELNEWITDLNKSYFKEGDTIYCEISYYTDQNDITTEEVTINPKTCTDLIYLPYGSYVTVTIYYPPQWLYFNDYAATAEVEETKLKDSYKSSYFSASKDFVTDYVSWVPEDYKVDATERD